MLPNTWNRFRQDADTSSHHFYAPDMHPNPPSVPMNMVLSGDTHGGIGTHNQNIGTPQPSLSTPGANINNHFQHSLRSQDRFKTPESVPDSKINSNLTATQSDSSSVTKKKSTNNGVLVKLPRTLRKEAKIWSRLYAQRDETGKFKQGFLMPMSLQHVLHSVIKKKDEEIANLKLKLAAYESTNARSSKYRGVSRNGQTGWCAVARSAEKGRVYCGTFPTEIEAAKAWDKKTIELTGDAAERRLNFPDDPEIQALLANARATKKSGTYSKYRGVEIIQNKYSPKSKRNQGNDDQASDQGNKTFLIRVHSKTVASCKSELEAAYGYNEVAYVLGLHATNDVTWNDFVVQSQDREKRAIHELRMLKREEAQKAKDSEQKKAKEKKQRKQSIIPRGMKKGSIKATKNDLESPAELLHTETYMNGSVLPKKRGHSSLTGPRNKSQKSNASNHST